jgi:hypothetical protein
MVLATYLCLGLLKNVSSLAFLSIILSQGSEGHISQVGPRQVGLESSLALYILVTISLQQLRMLNFGLKIKKIGYLDFLLSENYQDCHMST